MTKLELKNMIAVMETRGVPDSAEIRIRKHDNTSMALHGASFAIQGENAEVSLDASSNWVGTLQEANVVFLKQN